MIVKIKYVKIVGLLGGVLSGIALVLGGQTQEGIGLIFASLSSANLAGESDNTDQRLET